VKLTETMKTGANIMATKKDKEKLILSKKQEKEILKTDKPLQNLLQEKFCQFYAKSLNATKSYLLARKELNHNEITYDSARAIASKLLTDINVQTRLSEIRDKTAQTLEIDKSEIIQGIQNEIDSDPADVWNWTGDTLTLKCLNDIPLHVRQTIKSIKAKKDGDVEVTFYDKQKARDQLMKYLGMLNDSATVNVNFNIGETLQAAHQRVKKRADFSNAENAEFEEIKKASD
jgi:hypothetical protein